MDSTKGKVGLITYHAAYNFGSVLQAYATQKKIEDIGFEVEIIDYRTPSQTLWYTKDVTIKKGIKNLIKSPIFLRIKQARKERAEKFDMFIETMMNLSKDRFTKFADFNSLSYPILVSGSDQVWNIGCGEFRNEPSDAIRPYFLDFGKPEKRIAYASSFGTPTPLQVKRFIPFLKKYDYISTREPIGKKYIDRYLSKPVDLVCDPTWLLNKEEWSGIINVDTPQEPYILIYNLGWTFRDCKGWLSAIKKIADEKGWKVYCISPLNPLRFSGIEMLDNAGPIDFLAYLKNARLMITNTFHGTIFSLNFEIPFISCQAQSSSRQGQMLEMCGLDERIANNPSDLQYIDIKNTLDFSNSSKIINDFRESSINYLRRALSC